MNEYLCPECKDTQENCNCGSPTVIPVHVRTAQCWMDLATDKTKPMSDRLLGMHNAFNHTQNALVAKEKELDELSKANDWQPIETVPKDGTYFLVYSKNMYPRHVGFAYYCEKWDAVLSYLHGVPITATRWMPLPSPPETAAQI